MKITTLVGMLCFGLLFSPAHASTFDTCTRLEFNYLPATEFAGCKKLLEREDLSIRQRAQVLLYLGTAAELLNHGSSASTEKLKSEYDLWRQAMSIDPSFADPFLELADRLRRESKTKEALAVIEAGLSHSPEDGRLMVEKAMLRAGMIDSKGTQELCELAMVTEAIDHSALQRCAVAMDSFGLRDKAVEYYGRATDLYERKPQNRFGLFQDYQPAYKYAKYISTKMSKHAEAAVIMRKYLEREPALKRDPFHLEFLGDLEEKLGNHTAAAESYKSATERFFVSQDIVPIAMKQIVSLSNAGKADEALNAWRSVRAQMTKRQILQWQVKLKNGTQKQLSITGIADEATERAARDCFKDPDCYKGIFGRTL